MCDWLKSCRKMKEWGGKGETELEWMRWMGDGFKLRVDILKWMKASFHVYFLLFISFHFFICFSSNCFSFCVNFMTIGFFLVRFFLPFLVNKYHRLLFCSFWPSHAESRWMGCGGSVGKESEQQSKVGKLKRWVQSSDGAVDCTLSWTQRNDVKSVSGFFPIFPALLSL